jgi:acyl dehydratase
MTASVISQPPSAISVLSRALLSVTKRGKDPTLPDLSLVLERATTDPERLRAYSEICEFDAEPFMPALWPHILAFPLRMKLMGDARFPFPLPGLVHIKNHTVQHRAIRQDEVLRLECGVTAGPPHDKGITFVLVTQASVAGQLVWHDESTILYRARGTGASPRDDDDLPVDEPSSVQAWPLPADLGRRYGPASGDLNPIHMYPLTARAFGFRRPIAHGMWSAAHGLARLPEYDPSAPLTYSVWFKLPIFLPSKVTCRQKKLADGARFEIRDAKGEKPHVRGRLRHGVAAAR